VVGLTRRARCRSRRPQRAADLPEDPNLKLQRRGELLGESAAEGLGHGDVGQAPRAHVQRRARRQHPCDPRRAARRVRKGARDPRQQYRDRGHRQQV